MRNRFNPHQPVKAGASCSPSIFSRSIQVSILTSPLRLVLQEVPNPVFWLGFFPRLRGLTAVWLKSILQPTRLNEKIVIFSYDSSNAILPGFVPSLLVRAQTSSGSSKFTDGLTP